jgi:hypothetical protein
VHPELKTSWKSGEKLALTLAGLSCSAVLAPVTATVSEGRLLVGTCREREASAGSSKCQMTERSGWPLRLIRVSPRYIAGTLRLKRCPGQTSCSNAELPSESSTKRVYALSLRRPPESSIRSSY